MPLVYGTCRRCGRQFIIWRKNQTRCKGGLCKLPKRARVIIAEKAVEPPGPPPLPVLSEDTLLLRAVRASLLRHIDQVKRWGIPEHEVPAMLRRILDVSFPVMHSRRTDDLLQ